MKQTILAILLGLGSAAHAETAITVPFDGSFDDAAFAVESAIVGKGLVIDYVSHTGEMLNRTGADVGSDAELFKEADIFIFCSAVVSREVMEADPMNIAHCPYGIFVAENAEGVMIGYREYPAGEMQKVQALLADIVADAVEN
ncbi:protein of unknown function DUF302 [Cribrihabitans marinus]|uniref:DUF302 domain-containing protein n=1 Tax=Cribrihabitans marinus TaxID=1227549 RepID=A0A1H6V6V1_9RHOB|nr:DUF302 domain-containing protein [Cribrihabitans marinus]GGH26872.1 hypothetical protein GCM10010973_14810 [Cribrihabitans marinus]SEI95975.1 protein of unknown function DUF302 [Cribrihabitans marinus]